MKQSQLTAAISTVVTELSRRYGQTPGSASRGQLAHLAAELHPPDALLPYLYAVFLSDEAFAQVKQQAPTENWAGIEAAAQAAYSSLQHVSPAPDGFHESGKGFNGVGATR